VVPSTYSFGNHVLWIQNQGTGTRPAGQQRAQEIRDALRTVNSSLSLLSQRVGGHL